MSVKSPDSGEKNVSYSPPAIFDPQNITGVTGFHGFPSLEDKAGNVRSLLKDTDPHVLNSSPESRNMTLV